jgi:hypothetical protein
MLEFTTAVKETEVDDADAIEFDLDGVLCTAYRPKGGQFGMLMAMTTQYSTDQEAVAGLIQLFINMLDEDSQSYVVRRLFDRKDSFDISDVDQILRGLMEEWAGRPTEPPSDSASSPPSTGQKSTPRTPARTSSGSRRTASSTSSTRGR